MGHLNYKQIKTVLVFAVFLVFVLEVTGLLRVVFMPDSELLIQISLLNFGNHHYLLAKRIFFSSEFAFLLFFGLILVFILPLLSAFKGLLLSVAMGFLVFIVNNIGEGFTMIPAEYYWLTIFIIYLVAILLSYLINVKSRRREIEKLGQHIPMQMVNALSYYPKPMSLDAEAKILTIFFCDLRSFTSISEQFNPKQLNKLLSEYFTAMTEILFKHEGTIDKYIGDAIMAFWNAPIEQPRHAQYAVEASLEMVKAMKVLAKDFVKRGWPGLDMGIGINTGRANVGNMGSKYHMSYTVIGDPVNVASRIESLTRSYRIPIIISEHTYRQLEGIVCREIDEIRVKGKKQHTRIYQPLCLENELGNPLKRKLALHDEAFSLYKSGKFRNAAKLFKGLYETDPTDKFYKVIYKKALEAHKKTEN